VTSLFIAKPDDFGRFLLISLAGHAVAFMLFIGVNLVLAGPAIDLSAQPIKATLIRRGVKRDEKLLPRKEEQPPPPQQKQSVPSAKQDLFKALDKFQKNPSPSKSDGKNNLFDALKSTAKTAEQPEGDPNGDDNGDSATQEGERYFGLLASLVHRNYDVSSTIPDAERIRLVAWVVIKIGKAGELLKVDLTRSSKNEQFDQAVLAAVKKSAPFPPPPEHLRVKMQSDGVQFNFRP
jgi:TonB family protein